jgi:hypothetical protein
MIVMMIMKKDKGIEDAYNKEEEKISLQRCGIVGKFTSLSSCAGPGMPWGMPE